MEKNIWGMIAAILVFIGGINWGLYAFGYNVVNLVFGTVPVLEQIIYILVALSSIYVTYMYFAE